MVRAGAITPTRGQNVTGQPSKRAHSFLAKLLIVSNLIRVYRAFAHIRHSCECVLSRFCIRKLTRLVG